MDQESQQLPTFDALWNYNDSAGTEVKFRDVLSQLPTDANDDYRMELLTQIARTQGLQRQFDAAHRTLDEVEPVLGIASPTVNIRYMLERGRVFNSSKQTEQARALFLKAWEYGKTHNLDGYAVDTAHMMAIVEPPESAIGWNERAIAFAEKSNDAAARKWLGSLLNNLGWSRHARGEYDQALDCFERALAARREQGDEELIRIARWCIARCFRSLNRIEEALTIQRALDKERSNADKPDGYVQEELGECLLALGQSDKAKPHFMSAFQQLSQDPWLCESEPQRIERLRQLGT